MADPYKPDIVIGDSIAFGLAGVTGLPTQGMSRARAHPEEILGYIEQAVHTGTLKAKNVVLSSGLTNSYLEKGAMDLVREEVEALTKAGAHVTLVGVSNERDGLKDDNKELREIAKKYGATFASLTPTGADHIHPKSYTDLLRDVVAANAGGTGEERATALPQTPRESRAQQTAPAAPHGDPALDGIPHLSKEEALQVQALINKINARGQEHYDLGAFGKKHNGEDGIVGHMTGTSIHQFEDKHGLKDTTFESLVADLKKVAGEPAAAPSGQYHPGATPPEGKAKAASGKTPAHP